MENTSQTSPETPAPDGSADGRRNFLVQAAVSTVAVACLAVPAVIGLVTALNPLSLKSRAGKRVPLTTLDELPEDGTPRKFAIIDDRTDAWNVFPDQPVGGVFLRRSGKDKKEEVVAINATCPHLGGPLQYQETDDGGKFFCPLHSASFDLDGKPLDKPSPSPRRLDELDDPPPETKLDGGKQVVWVTFQDFETGKSTKVPKT
ncbi:MAG: Rieske 2Fe-2S domain-containing protein [Candidatus Nealsonbacteria bacterium]|nr:Rieske 2Fe-2S domain-containing protein [Candidatus Nealsonbacteria bacterium]